MTKQQPRAQKICLIAGLSEGKYHTRKCIRCFVAAGFTVTDDPKTADIIVVHSGGYVFLPDDLADKCVVLVNPPHQYRGTALKNTFRKIQEDYRHHKTHRKTWQFFIKNTWNIWYMLAEFPRQKQMIRLVPKQHTVLPKLNARRLVFVATRDDPWASRITTESITSNPRYSFISIEGSHDDIWMHPEHYVAIIKASYES